MEWNGPQDKEYLKILWEAEDGKGLMLQKLKLKQPDVVLMDIGCGN